LSKTNDGWTATLQIHPRAALLSWYVTDGKDMDANGEKTYVDYVYDGEGKPVRGAHFCMIRSASLPGRDGNAYS